VSPISRTAALLREASDPPRRVRIVRGPNAHSRRPRAANRCVRNVSDRRSGIIRSLFKLCDSGESACRRGSVPGEPGGGHPSTRPTWGHWTGRPSHIWPCSEWGLPSRPGRPGRWCALTAPFHPCLCLAAIGGLFSVALSCGSPRLAVSQHPALWSPDLPRRAPLDAAATTRPTRRRAHSRTAAVLLGEGSHR